MFVVKTNELHVLIYVRIDILQIVNIPLKRDVKCDSWKSVSRWLCDDSIILFFKCKMPVTISGIFFFVLKWNVCTESNVIIKMLYLLWNSFDGNCARYKMRVYVRRDNALWGNVFFFILYGCYFCFVSFIPWLFSLFLCNFACMGALFWWKRSFGRIRLLQAQKF